MILEAVFDILFKALTGLFEVLPNISWSTDTGAINTFNEFIAVILYILPMGTIYTLFGIVFAIIMFRIVIAVIKTIWDLLPLL